MITSHLVLGSEIQVGIQIPPWFQIVIPSVYFLPHKCSRPNIKSFHLIEARFLLERWMDGVKQLLDMLSPLKHR